MRKRLAAPVSAGVLMLMQAAVAIASSTDCTDWNTYAFFHESTAAQVQDCLGLGGDPNAREDLGDTPLHNAAFNNPNPDVVIALIAAGADPNVRGHEDSTPLYTAARWGRYPSVIGALLDGGADPKQRSGEGLLPIEGARMNDELDDSEVLQRLEEAPADEQ